MITAGRAGVPVDVGAPVEGAGAATTLGAGWVAGVVLPAPPGVAAPQALPIAASTRQDPRKVRPDTGPGIDPGALWLVPRPGDRRSAGRLGDPVSGFRARGGCSR